MENGGAGLLTSAATADDAASAAPKAAAQSVQDFMPRAPLYGQARAGLEESVKLAACSPPLLRLGPEVGGLFQRPPQREQRAFVEGAADQLQAERQAGSVEAGGGAHSRRGRPASRHPRKALPVPCTPVHSISHP